MSSGSLRSEDNPSDDDEMTLAVVGVSIEAVVIDLTGFFEVLKSAGRFGRLERLAGGEDMANEQLWEAINLSESLFF